MDTGTTAVRVSTGSSPLRSRNSRSAPLHTARNTSLTVTPKALPTCLMVDMSQLW